MPDAASVGTDAGSIHYVYFTTSTRGPIAPDCTRSGGILQRDGGFKRNVFAAKTQLTPGRVYLSVPKMSKISVLHTP